MAWVHPLDLQGITYRQYDKGQTLPTFWITCRGCERLFTDASDEELIERMKLSGGFRPDIDEWSPGDVDEVLRKPLAVFRAADLGRVALEDAAE